jgi:hypothetical protein
MPVTVVDEPKDQRIKRGTHGEISKTVLGASFQIYSANTNRDGIKSPSICGSGTTTYTVEIPRCDNNCECLIVVTVTGEVRGIVDAEAEDYFMGRATAVVDGRLWSNLGTSQAQLTLTSGEGAATYEASGELSPPPKANVKIAGKAGDGPLDKISTYSSGPVSFNACFADIVVTAEGAANSSVNWATRGGSYARSTILATHECKISCYCICNGERTMILEWIRTRWPNKSVYLRRSIRDQEYEKKLIEEREMLQKDVEKKGPSASKREQNKLNKTLESAPGVAVRNSEDGLSKMRELFENILSKLKNG